jgi:hypothetical protein
MSLSKKKFKPVRIAIIAASCPMSLQVGAKMVFRMLAPIRKARPRENAWPISSLLSFSDLKAFLPIKASFIYIIRDLIIPIKITTIANIWQIYTTMLLIDFITSAIFTPFFKSEIVCTAHPALTVSKNSRNVRESMAYYGAGGEIAREKLKVSS